MSADLREFWRAAGDIERELAMLCSDEPAIHALDTLGRPDISVRGRNLADVLRPVLDALREDSW